MKIVIDTNILILQNRNSAIWQEIEKTYFPKGVKNFGIISFATQAEIRSIATRLKWGKPRKERLERFLKQLYVVHSNAINLEKLYTQIDAFSQNQHKSLSLPKGMGAKNMGKNDIWIAATAAICNAPLVSTDRDFEHLNRVFFNFIYIDQLR